jgi:hypothetical protein
MKSNHSFGRALSREEQKVILGGDAPVNSSCSITCDSLSTTRYFTCTVGHCFVATYAVYCGTTLEFTCAEVNP